MELERVNKIIAAVVSMDAYITNINLKHKAELDRVALQRDVCIKALKPLFSDECTKIQTAAGVAKREKKDFVNVTDWDAFIRDRMVAAVVDAGLLAGISRDNFEALLQSMFDVGPMLYVNKSAKKNEIKAFRVLNNNRCPPGIKYEAKYEISVKKP